MDNIYNLVHAVEVRSNRHNLIDSRDDFIRIMYGVINGSPKAQDALVMMKHGIPVRIEHIINIEVDEQLGMAQCTCRFYNIDTYGTPKQTLDMSIELLIPVSDKFRDSVKLALLEKLK